MDHWRLDEDWRRLSLKINHNDGLPQKKQTVHLYSRQKWALKNEKTKKKKRTLVFLQFHTYIPPLWIPDPRKPLAQVRPMGPWRRRLPSPWGLGEYPGDLSPHFLCCAVCGAPPAALVCDTDPYQGPPLWSPWSSHLRAQASLQPILESHNLPWELGMRPLRCQVVAVLGTLPPWLQSLRTLLLAWSLVPAARAAPSTHRAAGPALT